VETRKLVVTIYNKDGQEYGEMVRQYGKFSKIVDFSGVLYDAAGEKIRELESKDINDYSAFSDYSLYEDTRMRIGRLYHDRYPYTVEFTYEISYDGPLEWPDWYSRMSLYPVEESTFRVTLPSDEELRYWANSDTLRPVVTNSGRSKTYFWEAHNLPELSRDVVGDEYQDVAPMVLIAPSAFEVEGFKGSMSSWNEFGKWFGELSKDKDRLPEAALNDIRALVRPGDDEHERIRKIYEYMQKRTRYVSVQLGIGGWQPYDATYVHDRGYGDCKALSNYTVGLLKAAGITAYPVLIESGNGIRPLIREFPSNQFNHVIVCVPAAHDTTWLECTSQTDPAGHLGSFTENRDALMITPGGGILVRTPTSQPGSNLQRRTVLINLDFTGDAYGAAFFRWEGDQQDRVRSALDDATPEDRTKWVVRDIDIPNVRINQCKIDGIKSHAEGVRAEVEFSVPHFGSVSGNRIFFQPNAVERNRRIPPAVDKRLSPVRYFYPYRDVDSILYAIPEGFKTESIPARVSLQSPFATFTSVLSASGDSLLTYVRTLEVTRYTIPADQYKEYRKFFTDVAKAERAQVVLIKQGP
ncbi:MAG TPA: DUF3857 and transglutaminase domain-containing protein, partial [Bacteroidota bacterium]